MQTLRALRRRLALLVIAALLLQSFAPSLYARVQRSAGNVLPWSDLCTTSGQTAGAAFRVDDDLAASRESLRLPLSHGDHHCPSCLTSFGGMPATVAGVRPIALHAAEGWADELRAPDRTSAWSAQQTRGPPVIS